MHHDKELKLVETNIAKGIAVILLLIHHLFAFPDRLKYDYVSLFSLFHERGEFYLGHFGQIAISIFLFLSGYGLYKSNVQNPQHLMQKSFTRLSKIMINYWVVFLLFIPVGLYFFGTSDRFQHNSIMDFLRNFIALSSSYNGEWWFLYDYILLLLIFPVTFQAFQRNTWVTLLIAGLVFYNSYSQGNYYSIMYWQLPFMIGLFFAKYKLYSWMNKIYNSIIFNNILFDIVVLVLLFRFRTTSQWFEKTTIDMIIAPVVILVSIHLMNKLKLTRPFAYLGKNSMNIWLTHTFFCYYYFQSIVFFPKVSILILLWLTLLTVLTSIIVNSIISLINNKVYTKNMDINPNQVGSQV
ncbi:acyltransferase family protein [Paenibacillus sp. EKM202P]|uniref:acyltransferase family protein n=1 Tax=Paenibacillus TaxID=44249 RepID=UPI00058A3C5A|nr:MULTISPECIES: acyltransferase family protein [Paenibacillus]AJE51226.1 acyltransferase [Paenibacillus polymyxa]KAF6562014.1 acyltransferase family protein [Paenibacillus sp. EKM202P]KAF6566302.1 acyltransferase family protein [Paenibacillus sp. EKM207P]MCV9951992.1 acyltransferase [Paenibacillus sp. BT-177]